MSNIYIGLMSGTSLDAIDAVAINFSKSQPEIICHHNIDYPEEIKKSVRTLSHNLGHVSLQTLGELDCKLGSYYAQIVNELLSKKNLKAKNIAAIGSHGQTIFHAPEGQYPFSMQIGNGNIIAARTGIPCITDFRGMDIAVGGQGAPLAPAFHQALFSSRSENRIILNLGGIANISLLPKNNTNIIGYDTGPANTLMDIWVHKHLGKKYDKDGQWARSGTIDQPLLAMLLDDSYFSLNAPKSTGTEYFHLTWLNNILQKQPTTLSPEDIQATLCELTAISVTDEIKKHPVDSLYVCGGGSENKFLLERIQYQLPRINISTTAALGINPQLVEASCFGWLAQQYILKNTGNLPSVTGAKAPVILGCLYYPPTII